MAIGNKAKLPKGTGPIQMPVRIPRKNWQRVIDAMEYDGITAFSQFSHAAIMQRVRRIEQQKALEEAETGKK